jgi:hypothetical protein
MGSEQDPRRATTTSPRLAPSMARYGESLSLTGPIRSTGSVTPPPRPSSPARHHRRTHSAPRPVKVIYFEAKLI